MPEAAICVQDIDVQCVLQFTLIHAAGCALHRHTSRVIHRQELYCFRIVPPRSSRALDRRHPAGRVYRVGSVTVVDGIESEMVARGERPGDRRRLFKPRQNGRLQKVPRYYGCARQRSCCVTTTIEDASPRRIRQAAVSPARLTMRRLRERDRTQSSMQ